MAGRGHRTPEKYDASAFPSFAVTVDVVILTMLDGRLHVLLVRRQADPYAGAWALPGGFKRTDETLDEAAARELREETGVVAPRHLAQFGAYGDPGRDPRTNVVTVAYLAVTPDVGEVIAGSDADDARLWPVADVVSQLELAFDHRRILADAVERAAEQLEQTDLATAFVGPDVHAVGAAERVRAAVGGRHRSRQLPTQPLDAATPASGSAGEPDGGRARRLRRGDGGASPSPGRAEVAHLNCSGPARPGSRNLRFGARGLKARRRADPGSGH